MPISRAGRPAPNKRRAQQRLRTAPRPGARQRGFAYALVLVALVLVGIFAGVANLRTSRIVQADREAELLFRGQAYRKAIASYHAVAGRYPRSLRELLKDPRLAQRSHLRTLYPDPMAEMAERAAEDGGWRLVRAPDGGIAGVASRSPQAPLKQVDFPAGLEKFEGARRYDEWVFEYAPRPAAGNRPSAPAALLHPR